MQTEYLIKVLRALRPIASACSAKARALGTNDARVAALAFQAGLSALGRIEYLYTVGKLTNKIVDNDLPVVKKEFATLAELVSTIPKDTLGQRLTETLRYFDPPPVQKTSELKSEVKAPEPVEVPETDVLPILRLKVGEWKT